MKWLRSHLPVWRSIQEKPCKAQFSWKYHHTNTFDVETYEGLQKWCILKSHKIGFKRCHY